MTKLSLQFLVSLKANAWSSARFRATQILTDWTNVSTAMGAVKGLVAEMTLPERAPQPGKNWSSGLGHSLLQRLQRKGFA
jgi:hypothetical protein